MSVALGLGLCLVLQACPQVGLVSAFCACPPTFALDFLHPRPRGRKLVLNFWVPPNWPRGDLHSRADVMSSVPKKRPEQVRPVPAFQVIPSPSFSHGNHRITLTRSKRLRISHYVRQRTGKTLSQLRKARNAPKHPVRIERPFATVQTRGIS